MWKKLRNVHGSLSRYARYLVRRLARHSSSYSLALVSRRANSRHETTSPGVTNTKYAGEKCFAPLATPRHFLGSPASPRRITVRRDKRVAHYFYESSRISPEVSEDTLAAFFPTLLSYPSFHPSIPSFPRCRSLPPLLSFYDDEGEMIIRIRLCDTENKSLACTI